MQAAPKPVEYREFESKFKKYHPQLNYNQARNKFNKLWKELRVKHEVNGKTWTHHKGAKDFPIAFHQECRKLFKKWEIKYDSQKLRVKKLFYGLYSNKSDENKNNNKNKNKKIRPLSNAHSAQRQKKQKTKSKDELLDEFVSEISLLQSFETLSRYYREGIFKWLLQYYNTTECRDFTELIVNHKFGVLYNDLKYLNITSCMYYAHIVESELFTSQKYPSLQIIITECLGYKCIKNDIQTLFGDIANLLTSKKEYITKIKQREDEKSKCLSILYDIIAITKMENMLKSVNLNSLQNNYANKNRKYRSQDMVINDIRRIDTLIFSYGLIKTLNSKNRIKKLQEQREKETKQLNKLQRQCINSRRYRNVQKDFYRELETKYGIEIIRCGPGKRRCEDRPGNERLMSILQTMVDEQCLADPRRKSEIGTFISSIPHVVAQLHDMGITISESSARRRFEPALKTSNAAKRYHTKCVKATIKRIRNDGRELHIAARFNFAFRRMLKQLISYIGAGEAAYLGLDDKDKLKVGTVIIMKGKKQILSTEHPTQNPDHTFPKGRGYKIICSVQKAYEILDNVAGSSNCITYRGLTKIILRSGIDDSSTATAHGLDLIDMINDERFGKYIRNPRTNEIASNTNF